MTHAAALQALAGRSVLLVEDEVFIALDIATELEMLGARVIGPTATAEEAVRMIGDQGVDGAIADVNLLEGDVLPLLIELSRRNVPAVIHTGGALPWAYHDRFPELPVCTKPTTPTALAEALGAQVMEAGPSGKAQ